MVCTQKAGTERHGRRPVLHRLRGHVTDCLIGSFNQGQLQPQAPQESEPVALGEYTTAFGKNSVGVRLLETGDYEGAVVAFSEAIALKPDDATFYRNRAAAHSNLGRVILAQSDAEMAGTLQTRFVPSQSGTRENDNPDRVGTGRYVLSFFLAGFIGLGIQYMSRDQGWLATLINAFISVAILVALLGMG